MMKKNSLCFAALMMAIVLNLGLISCGGDDNDTNVNNDPSMSFTSEMITGKWTVSEISGNNTHNGLIVGVEYEFNTDGTCVSWFSMENAYRIEKGRLHTYCSKNNEPMYVYTLLSQNGQSLTVRMDGTLDSKSSCTLVLQKLK